MSAISQATRDRAVFLLSAFASANHLITLREKLSYYTVQRDSAYQAYSELQEKIRRLEVQLSFIRPLRDEYVPQCMPGYHQRCSEINDLVIFRKETELYPLLQYSRQRRNEERHYHNLVEHMPEIIAKAKRALDGTLSRSPTEISQAVTQFMASTPNARQGRLNMLHNFVQQLHV